jgi:hypothetical protein
LSKKRKKNFQAIYFHFLPGSGKPFLSSKVKEKKEKFPSYIFSLAARSQQAFSLPSFEEKRRKMSKLIIFTCCQVPASLFYLQILKKKEENFQAKYFNLLPGPSKSFLLSNFEEK